MRYVVATLLLLLAAVIGERPPDLDQRTTLLLHRSIVTHSPFVPLALSLVALSIPNVPVRWFAIGICASVCVHLAFDLFPRGWMRFALVSLPFYGWTSPLFSQVWLAGSVLVCAFLAARLAKGLETGLVLLVLAGVFLYAAPSETETLRPALVVTGCALVVLLFRRKSDQA